MRKIEKPNFKPNTQPHTGDEVMPTKPLENLTNFEITEFATSAQASLESLDPFDPARFVALGSIAGNIGVVKQLVTCPVRKPSSQEFVRVHADTRFCLRAFVIEIKEERETYLVYPAVAIELPSETRVVSLRLAINRQGAIFLWPVPEPRLDGHENAWWSSARIAADKAMCDWTRMVANKSQGAYDVFIAPGVLGDPVWPDKSMGEIIKVSFGEKFIIRDAEHPVIRRMLGLS